MLCWSTCWWKRNFRFFRKCGRFSPHGDGVHVHVHLEIVAGRRLPPAAVPPLLETVAAGSGQILVVGAGRQANAGDSSTFVLFLLVVQHNFRGSSTFDGGCQESTRGRSVTVKCKTPHFLPQNTAEVQKDPVETSNIKSEGDELGVESAVETVERKPAPVTMTQTVKLIADIDTLCRVVSSCWNKLTSSLSYIVRRPFSERQGSQSKERNISETKAAAVVNEFLVDFLHIFYSSQVLSFYETVVTTHIRKLGVQSTSLFEGEEFHAWNRMSTTLSSTSVFQPALSVCFVLDCFLYLSSTHIPHTHTLWRIYKKLSATIIGYKCDDKLIIQLSNLIVLCNNIWEKFYSCTLLFVLFQRTWRSLVISWRKKCLRLGVTLWGISAASPLLTSNLSATFLVSTGEPIETYVRTHAKGIFYLVLSHCLCFQQRFSATGASQSLRVRSSRLQTYFVLRDGARISSDQQLVETMDQRHPQHPDWAVSSFLLRPNCFKFGDHFTQAYQQSNFGAAFLSHTKKKKMGGDFTGQQLSSAVCMGMGTCVIWWC